MEWVPSEEADEEISGSQDSCRSISNKNPESTLTAEERNEMKESKGHIIKANLS